MTYESDSSISRRRVLQTGLLSAAGTAIPGSLLGAEPDLITKTIPSTGQKIPAVGIGANQFGSTEYPVVRDILGRMHGLGGRVICTASAYGQSEVVIGKALAELELTRDMFLTTMFDMAGVVASRDPVSGKESVERSFERLKKIDLMFIHLLVGVDSMMPILQELKRQGRVSYIGITNVYRHEDDQRLIECLRKFPLDFVQVPYSIGDRVVEQEILPLCQERKIAVMAAVPFGGRRGLLFPQVGDRKLPAWAADYGIASWSQFFLKYSISHPAVTCAVPGSTKLTHLEENQAAGRGLLPDAAARKKMEAFWEAKA